MDIDTWRRDELGDEPIYCAAPVPLDPDDTAYPENDESEDDVAKVERRLRYEQQGRSYLEGRPLRIMSATLRGPFHDSSGWRNPWLPARIESRMRPGSHRPIPEASCEIVERIATEQEDTAARTDNSVLRQLPSPQSYRDFEPVSELIDGDKRDRIQAWAKSVPSLSVERDEFWAPDQAPLERSCEPSRKRPAGKEWLKTKPVKRSKKSARSATRSFDTLTPSSSTKSGNRRTPQQVYCSRSNDNNSEASGRDKNLEARPNQNASVLPETVETNTPPLHTVSEERSQASSAEEAIQTQVAQSDNPGVVLIHGSIDQQSEKDNRESDHHTSFQSCADESFYYHTRPAKQCTPSLLESGKFSFPPDSKSCPSVSSEAKGYSNVEGISVAKILDDQSLPDQAQKPSEVQVLKDVAIPDLPDAEGSTEIVTVGETHMSILAADNEQMGMSRDSSHHQSYHITDETLPAKELQILADDGIRYDEIPKTLTEIKMGSVTTVTSEEPRSGRDLSADDRTTLIGDLIDRTPDIIPIQLKTSTLDTPTAKTKQVDVDTPSIIKDKELYDDAPSHRSMAACAPYTEPQSPWVSELPPEAELNVEHIKSIPLKETPSSPCQVHNNLITTQDKMLEPSVIHSSQQSPWAQERTTPEPKVTIRSFAKFNTPSPRRQSRHSMRSYPSGGQRRGILIGATPSNPWGDLSSNHISSGRHVSFAPFPGEDHDSSGVTSQKTTRAASPPPDMPTDVSDVENFHFTGHFDTLKRRTANGSRSRFNAPRTQILPSASQQREVSPPPEAMAQAFRQADAQLQTSVQLGDESVEEMEFAAESPANAEATPQSPWRGESQDVDDVAAVMGNLDEFLGAWDVDAEIDKAQQEAQEAEQRKRSPNYGDMNAILGTSVWG
ncbi:hypothetical protein F5Y15DRAFT_375375 [Xylariaceae sp. FL0016]|nr:hypothetical protein F5Y15DRAFT_375375 [Xylariaceae sp. FL0016]